MDLRGQSDMRKLEEVTGRKYKPLKYWANFDPSDAKLVFDVSPQFVCVYGAAMTLPTCLPTSLRIWRHEPDKPWLRRKDGIDPVVCVAAGSGHHSRGEAAVA